MLWCYGSSRYTKEMSSPKTKTNKDIRSCENLIQWFSILSLVLIKGDWSDCLKSEHMLYLNTWPNIVLNYRGWYFLFWKLLGIAIWCIQLVFSYLCLFKGNHAELPCQWFPIREAFSLLSINRCGEQGKGITMHTWHLIWLYKMQATWERRGRVSKKRDSRILYKILPSRFYFLF